MSNRNEHIAFGLLAGLFYGFIIIHQTYLIGLAFVLVLSGIGSILPDIIEPPTSPWHRSVFHSWELLIALSLVLLFIFNTSLSLFAALIVGYLSHLVADSTTPRSLPSILY